MTNTAPNNVKAGDRVRLLAMTEDPDPIPVGTTGTVTWVNELKMFGPDRWQISVDWDNDRKLMLAIPADRFEVIS